MNQEHLGLGWAALERTDGTRAVLNRIKRDRVLESDPFTANPVDLANILAALAHLRDRITLGATDEEVSLLADAATHLNVASALRDPTSLQTFGDLQFTLVDILTSRELCSPRSLVALALEWKDFENAAAMWLLRETARRVAEGRWIVAAQRARTNADLVFVWCGLADLYGIKAASINAARRGWEYANWGAASVRRFALWRYRVVLERYGCAADLIEAARLLEVQLNQEGGPLTDWIVKCRWRK